MSKILPVIVYNKTYRVILYRAVEDINRLQTEEAIDIAKARH